MADERCSGRMWHGDGRAAMTRSATAVEDFMGPPGVRVLPLSPSCGGSCSATSPPPPYKE
jgi:hypothetical protein